MRSIVSLGIWNYNKQASPHLQVRDKWGFQMTGRHAVYVDLLRRYARADFEPQIVRGPAASRGASLPFERGPAV